MRPPKAVKPFQIIFLSATYIIFVANSNPQLPTAEIESQPPVVISTGGWEATILIPIYNKAHYLNLSLPSIFRLPIDPHRICVLCYDDGSTDNTVSVIQQFQLTHPQLFLILGGRNRGTLYARIQLIEATRTPWLTFLDPDDEFFGAGLPEALEIIKKTGADIVQFGCRMVIRNKKSRMPCWREPIGIEEATPQVLTQLWLDGKVDVHLHRKVWRTDLFQRAVWSMPSWLKTKRILRSQDILLYGYVLLNMRGMYQYIKKIGEIRHFGWPDNSQSEYYQSINATRRQVEFVANWTRKLFGRSVPPV
jgi:glycosyltransferase involved in cell wall biosynthesis